MTNDEAKAQFEEALSYAKTLKEEGCKYIEGALIEKFEMDFISARAILAIINLRVI